MQCVGWVRELRDPCLGQAHLSVQTSIGLGTAGEEWKMDPLPDFGYDDYEGCGKLKGKVTAISTLVRTILLWYPGWRASAVLFTTVMRSSAGRAQREVSGGRVTL